MRLKVLGFEVLDLLAVFLLLSILNIFFGSTELKYVLVWLPTIILALILRYGKRDKPDNYILHWIRYCFSPGIYSAYLDPSRDVASPGLERTVQNTHFNHLSEP